MSIEKWLNPQECPSERPAFEAMSASTQDLHKAIDANIRKSGMPYLHPTDKTVQLDLLGSAPVIDWQENKVAFLFEGEACWSQLPQLYARYGTQAGQELLRRIREIEGSSAALACDSGMQACAVVFDVLLEPNSHAVIFRQVYNKTAKYLDWAAERCGSTITVVDDGDHEGLIAAIQPNTRFVFAETYTNPLLRALDLVRVPQIVREARTSAKRIKLVVDSTIATCWGVSKPLLSHGVDVVLFSGTKAFGGQDRDMGGFIATNDNDLANAAMDLLAMRGGILDWRRADAFLQGLDQASEAHLQRCNSASEIATFLESHPLVESVFHPSLRSHPDADAISQSYSRPGSLLSFRLVERGEPFARRLSDALATCLVVRYALSFDGLTTKVNHHKSVSEYFTPRAAMQRNQIEELVRLGVGIEAPADICAALNWALHHGVKMSDEELTTWRKQRASELGLQV
ncbi:MAG: PLP-dependent transferase [Kofleriaceae bacterium]|nr:PLP-dependent transferase [Kofleriaceae bacterium]